MERECDFRRAAGHTKFSIIHHSVFKDNQL